MDLWSPPHDAPHLLEWWRPLMLVSRRARLDRFPWPVHLDEFRLAGRVRRQGRPDIWIYDHHENSGSVCVDAAGQTYRFFATPKGKGVGQFRPCELRSALWRARLPDVVEPVVYGPDAARGWLGVPGAGAGPGDGKRDGRDGAAFDNRGFTGPGEFGGLDPDGLDPDGFGEDGFGGLGPGGFGEDGFGGLDDDLAGPDGLAPTGPDGLAPTDLDANADGVDADVDRPGRHGRVVRRGHLTLIAG